MRRTLRLRRHTNCENAIESHHTSARVGCEAATCVFAAARGSRCHTAMTISHFFFILKARWISALMVFVISAAAVITWGVLRPKQYTATASVLADVKSDPIAGAVLQGTATPSYMLTQVDVIQSPRVARRVVRALKLDEDPKVRANWQKATHGEGELEAWIAERLSADLDVRPSRGSNVINIAYTGPNPATAAKIANAFVQSYLSATVELRVEPAKLYSSFFDDRAKQTRDALEKAQAALSAFQQQKGLVTNDERLDVELARLSALSSQLVALQALAAESGGRAAQATGNAGRMQEELSSPLVASLSTDLSRQMIRLKELSERLGDNHPQVIEAKSSIAETRTRLEAATKNATGSVTVNDNVNQTRLAQLNAEIAAQRAKVMRFKGSRDEAAVLQRDVENAQRAYDGVLARLNQSSLESQTAQSNLSALAYATEPTRPSSPGLRQNVVLALLLGIVLACVTAVSREWQDRRVRTAGELPLLVQHPLIGVVPSFAKAKRLPFSSARLMFKQKSASLPAA
jgi:succinoglycan biosynthesis transport protein ExoP